jgi:2-oxoglutarate ferredoxin oxidoreductase subunit gamma
MHQEVIMAGTGGQGVMVIGQLLAYAAVIEDKNVVWFPSYGPEARGGSADCTVIVSSEEIGSPVTAMPDTLIAMNQQPLSKFISTVKREGVVLVNSSLAELPKDREDCKVVGIPANDIANELGDLRVANMVMMGAFIELLKPVKLDSVIHALSQVIPKHRHNLLPLNEKALRRGAELIAQD